MKALFPGGCRRVLLVQPPHVPAVDYDPAVAIDNRYPVYPPYGLGVLSATLQARGYETDLLDLNFLLQKQLEQDPPSFAYNAWERWLRDKVEVFRPDLVGLSCMFSISYRSMKATAELLKRCYPHLPVVAGGVQPSQASQLVLDDAVAIDFVSLYEGAASFPDVLDVLNGRLPADRLLQVAMLVDGHYAAIAERAAKTPASVNVAPDYHDLPIGSYSPTHGRIGTYYWLWPEGTRASTVLATVGCRAQCTFCSVRTFNGRGVVARDVHHVVDEIARLKEIYGISHIMWLDDDLLYDEARTLALFNELARRRLGVTWDASNGIIASAVTEELAQAAAESGCIGLSLGIESGNAGVLRAVKKPSGVRHFHRAAEILRRHPGIFLKGLLMCGFPGESIGMQLDTVALANEIRLDWYTIQPLNLLPGVEITNHLLVERALDPKTLIDGTERPFVGSTGGQIRREDAERHQALPFADLLAGDPCRVPEPREIKDIWFLMDYRVNYERLWSMDNPLKLGMLRKLFVNICDKTHHENALGNLYFALIEHQLGNRAQARERLGLARHFAAANDYWTVRFEVLGLDRRAAELEAALDRGEEALVP